MKIEKLNTARAAKWERRKKHIQSLISATDDSWLLTRLWAIVAEIDNPKVKYKETPPEVANESSRKWAENAQGKTRTKASNRGAGWTEKDIEFINSSQLEDVEIARVLGRTLYGVKSYRKRLRKKGRN